MIVMKLALAVFAAFSALQVYWIAAAFLGSGGFAGFWTSSGMAYYCLIVLASCSAYLWRCLRKGAESEGENRA